VSEEGREVVFVTETAFVSDELALHGYGELRMPVAFAAQEREKWGEREREPAAASRRPAGCAGAVTSPAPP